MLFCLDEGSGACKTGKNTFPSYVVDGIQPSQEGVEQHVYYVSGLPYTVSSTSVNTLETTSEDYQYSIQNLVLVAHSLHIEKVSSDTEVDLVVTLPLTQYFDGNNMPNKANIEEKRQNLMQPVHRFVEGQKMLMPKIKSVRIIPEALPALVYASALTEIRGRTLTVDIGEFTIDFAIINKEGGIEWFKSTTKATHYMIDHLFRNSLPEKYQTYSFEELKKGFKDGFLSTENISEYKKAAISNWASLIDREIPRNQRKLIDQVLPVGGGAEILNGAVHSWNFERDAFIKVNTPANANILGMRLMVTNS